MMLLMNGDIPVLQFDINEQYLKILNNDHLPYQLKDYIKSSDNCHTREDFIENAKYIDCLKDYFSKRMINFSRENAKAILHTRGFSQSLSTNERLKIVFSCQALSITDNIWVKPEGSAQTFKDVNLRNHHLRDAAYEISILGKDISVEKEIIQPDIGTNGMFAKTWVRYPDKIMLWKTDKTSNNINSQMEVKASEFLDQTNVNHVKYRLIERDNLKIAECECLANDKYSIIDGYELSDWCDHQGLNFNVYLEEHFLEDFSKMCVLDYLIANTDRHLGNMHFFVNNETNEIESMCPLLDHNQSFIADIVGTKVDDLIYEPTGLNMLDTAVEYYKSSNIKLPEIENEYVRERLNTIIDIIQGVPTAGALDEMDPADKE